MVLADNDNNDIHIIFIFFSFLVCVCVNFFMTILKWCHVHALKITAVKWIVYIWHKKFQILAIGLSVLWIYRLYSELWSRITLVFLVVDASDDLVYIMSWVPLRTHLTWSWWREVVLLACNGVHKRRILHFIVWAQMSTSVGLFSIKQSEQKSINYY